MDSPEPQVTPLQQVSSPEVQRAPPVIELATSRRRWVKIAIAATLCLLLLAWALRNVVLGTPVATFPVRVGDLTQTVVASGRVMTPERVAIASLVVGRVTRIAVKEGSQVARDDLLIELDSSDARAALAQAQASQALASAQLRALREVELPAAMQNQREAQANLTQADQQLMPFATSRRVVSSVRPISTARSATAMWRLRKPARHGCRSLLVSQTAAARRWCKPRWRRRRRRWTRQEQSWRSTRSWRQPAAS